MNETGVCYIGVKTNITTFSEAESYPDKFRTEWEIHETFEGKVCHQFNSEPISSTLQTL